MLRGKYLAREGPGSRLRFDCNGIMQTMHLFLHSIIQYETGNLKNATKQNYRVRTDFSEIIQDFFNTFSRPKVNNSRPQIPDNVVNIQTLLLLRQTSGKHALAERHAHACLLVTALKRFACSIKRPDIRSRKEHFRSFRTRFARRSLTGTTTSIEVWVQCTFCSKVQSWSPDSSATPIGRELIWLSNWTPETKTKKERKKNSWSSKAASFFFS